MRRRRQRGGSDRCIHRAMIRLPAPYGCLRYDDARLPAALNSVDPFYADQLHKRVIAAVLEYCTGQLRAGVTPTMISASIREQFADRPWPAAILASVQRIRTILDEGRMQDFDAIRLAYRKFRHSVPPYAAMSSPSPVRSEEPVLRTLNYSETANADQTPPHTATTKAALLAWIAAAPHADIHDPISLEPWADMSVDELRHTVRTEEGRVYTTESLEGILRAAVDADLPARNAYSRRPLTRKNLRALRDVMRRSNPAYELPSRVQQRPPKHMGFSVAETADGRFYQLSLIDSRDGTELADLGYVPANIDASVSGSADVTSAVALATLQRAWESGRFLSSYKRPFQCCRFHLGKTAAYWSEPGGTPVTRLAAMIDEIRSVL